MTFNNSNRKHLREAEKSARLAEVNRIAYTRQIMSTLPGRAWMHDLLLRCSVFHTPFVAGAPDISAFNCGKQNLGLSIFGDVASHCPNEYTLMMTEASIKDLSNDRRNDESTYDSGTGTAEGFDRDPIEPADLPYGIDSQGFVNGAEA